MPLGPGKYDHFCTQVKQQAKADGILLIVFGGERGDGFSIQAEAGTVLQLPTILRMVADDIERDHAGVVAGALNEDDLLPVSGASSGRGEGTQRQDCAVADIR